MNARIVLLLFAARLAAAQAVVTGPLVVSDRWPECTTLAGWTEDVMRLEGLKHAPKPRRRKLSFTAAALLAHGDRRHDSGVGRRRRSGKVCHDAHKNLFVYGWDTRHHQPIAEAA